MTNWIDNLRTLIPRVTVLSSEVTYRKNDLGMIEIVKTEVVETVYQIDAGIIDEKIISLQDQILSLQEQKDNFLIAKQN